MYSFDIFDTLITRTTATPKGIFSLMQDELLHNKSFCDISVYIKSNFYYLRTNAERLAYAKFRSGGNEEVTLEQIYKALAVNGDISLKDQQLLIELEQRTEYNNSIGIQKNIERVKSLVREGHTVVLISDMYLDILTIRSMLMKADPIFEKLTIYVSSEQMRCKWSGKLYQVVKEHENIEFASWYHIGDNPISDIQAAGRLGIQTEQYNYEAFTELEKELLTHRENEASIQLAIGSARNTRLDNSLKKEAAIGCSYGGIILFPYVWWLLDQSLKKGLHRLYFIARDGYILKEIADIIIKEMHYNISTYYINGSRRAWRMASISEDNCDIERMLSSSYIRHVTTLRELETLLQLEENELIEFLPLLKGIDPNKVISSVMWYYIKKEFSNHKCDLINFLLNKHKVRRQMAIAYLKQELDYSDPNFAFVEMTGSGLTQGCLAELMQEFCEYSIQTFYFKLDNVTIPKNCTFYTYIPSMFSNHLVLEMLSRAPHGQTEGYKEEKQKIIPVINETEEKAFSNHGLMDYIDGIKRFSKTYLSAVQYNQINPSRVELAVKYIDYITKTPDKVIMDFIGGMPNSITGREATALEFAPILTCKDVRKIFLMRSREPIEALYPASSLDYSIMRSSEKVKRRIDFYKRHHDSFLGKLVRYPKESKSRRYKYTDKFPYELLYGRIVLYAAGKVGQALYKEIRKRKTCEIIQWVDKNYTDYTNLGMEIASPDRIGSISFDQIVIAMLNEQQADMIISGLVEQDIPKDKIIWMNLKA